MTKLSVNLNKVALLRNSRTLGIPAVTRCARIALEAGAHGITVHPRPDGRHIRTHDVDELAALLRDYPGAELNIEGNPFHEVLDIVRRVKPHQCTLVPDDPGAFTSDHGWNLGADAARLRPIVGKLRSLGIRVSLFMDPTAEAMAAARDIGADRVELYTEPYAHAYSAGDPADVLAQYVLAAQAAQAAGLGVNAGHDLNLWNLPEFVRAVPKILEVSIGHALTADALEMGFHGAVVAYLRALGHAAGA